MGMIATVLTNPRRFRRTAMAANGDQPRSSAAVIGGGALAALVACMFLLGASAAARRSPIVPRSGFAFPDWVAGPLHWLGLSTGNGVRVALVVAICACYVAILACAGAIGSRRLWIGIVLAHVAALLAPPLLSGDVFGYLGFARLGVLHDLNPYRFTASAAPTDAIYRFLGWKHVTTPYGPLFTLLSYGAAPLGLAGGLWALKLLAALASLTTVAILWRIAALLGGVPNRTVAFYAFNPLVLIFAVAGAHNETLFGALLAAGVLWMVTGRERAAGASIVLAGAMKASAALMAPFALLGSERRGRTLVAMLATTALVAVVGLSVFGAHLTDIFGALSTEQHDVSGHSVPAELSHLFGASGLPFGVRAAFIAAFAAVAVAMLWHTWRGGWWLDAYAWTTLALLAATGWLWPWYGLWALLPASLSSSRRLRLVTLAACAYLMLTRLAVGDPLSSG
jgi:alpha-1,6-mannosyltransferase